MELLLLAAVFIGMSFDLVAKLATAEDASHRAAVLASDEAEAVARSYERIAQSRLSLSLPVFTPDDLHLPRTKT